MRFMVMVKATPATEGGAVQSAEELAEMGRYNDELIKAGVLLAGEGLLSSSEGARVTFTNGTPTVIDGPFTEAKELVAGFWLLDVKSKAEAIEWVKRIPCSDDQPSHVEVRRVFEAHELIAPAESGE